MERLTSFDHHLVGVSVVLWTPLEIFCVHAPAAAAPRVDWLDQVEVIRWVHPEPRRVERATVCRVLTATGNNPRHFELGDSLDACWYLPDRIRHPPARRVTRLDYENPSKAEAKQPEVAQHWSCGAASALPSALPSALTTGFPPDDLLISAHKSQSIQSDCEGEVQK